MQARGPLKSFILMCSVGYFLFAMLLVALEKFKGITPPPPMPGQFFVTILAVVGIVWGLRKDKPKGK